MYNLQSAAFNPIRGATPGDKHRLAIAMRKNPTCAGETLWAQLRAGGLARLHFRRQQPILGVIVDCYCHKARLAIEIDGRIHDRATDYDNDRDSLLVANGFAVPRFTNDQVLAKMSEVLESICRLAEQRIAKRARTSALSGNVPTEPP